MRRQFRRALSLLLAAALLIPSGLFAPIAKAETVTVYHETFTTAGSVGKATQSGGANLAQQSGVVFDGNSDGGALYVSNRANTWDAADFTVSGLGLEVGKTYTVTASVYVAADAVVPNGAAIAYPIILNNDSNREWKQVTVAAGQAQTITSTFTVGSDDKAFRVQSNEEGKTVPFYIGEVLITTEETVTTPPPSGDQVMTEGFEAGQAGWTGNGATATVTDAVYRSGDYSLLVTGRGQTYHGPSLVLTDKLAKGATYQISGYVRLDPSASAGAQIKMTMEQTGETITDGNEQYKQVAGYQNVTKDAWVHLTGSYTYNPDATAIKLYVESDSATVSFALDDFSITKTADAPVVTTIVLSQSFEDDQNGGWALKGWGGGTGTIAVSSEQASAGTKSLKLSNRNSNEAQPLLDVTSLLKAGNTYDISLKARLGSGTETFHVASKVVATPALSNEYPWLIGNKEVNSTDWTTFEIKGHTVPGDATSEYLIWLEPAGTSNADIYIDEVLIKDVTPGQQPTRDPALPFATITFEDGQNGGFVGRAGTETLTVTDEANHTSGGSKALKVEGRTVAWHGPSLRVEKYVDLGYEYTVSAWVKLISPDSSQIQLSTQVGNGDSAGYNTILGKTITTADGWVLYEGKYRYNSAGDEYLTIYVESSNNATASFYIDDISFVRGGGPIDVQKDLTPIKDLYANDFLIGNAINASDLAGPRSELLKLHHNVVTAENAMKPDATQPTKGNFTFADSLVDGAIAQGMKVHGHVLVWHQQTPAWMNTANDQPLSRAEALENMRTHIKTTLEHYGNKLISWDVVNEAMNDNPANPTDWKNALRRSAWYNSIGPDYVEQAFLAAREVLDQHPDWDIKLYYNDYNDDNQNKATAIYSMVKEINDRYAQTHPGKLLIDGIGMQAHYNLGTKADNVRLSLEKFISLGVEISVTELDIQAGSNSQLSQQQANAQGTLYAQLFKLYKEHANKIARVTFWGLNDATSWRAAESPLLFDKDLQAKPAYYAVVDPDKFLTDHPPVVIGTNQTTANYSTPRVDGTADSIWNGATAIPVNRYQQAWQGATGTAKALWDDQNLYVLVQVNDSQLNKASANAWEQDSIEVFVDENNAKTPTHQADDGQYRVNYDNEQSFGGSTNSTGFASATKVSGTNYTVEVKIPLRTIKPGNNTVIGFDVQINDAKDGTRQSVAAWNDPTGTGYADTSVFGELKLTGKPAPTTPPSGTPSGGTVETTEGGNVAIKPEVKTEGNRVTSTVSNDSLKKALEQAAPATGGKKQVVIEVPAQAGAKAYEVQLPTQSLKSEESYVLALKTETATLQIPSNMLSTVASSVEQVAIRVAQADPETIDPAVRERIGSRPVLDLDVVAGGQEIAWRNPDAPVSIAIPYTPTEEEKGNPDSIVIWYIADDGTVTAIPNGRYDEASGTVVFQTTHFSTYAVVSVEKTFGDLKSVPWAKQAIEAMAARDVIRGTLADHYSPRAFVKRADFVALLVRALELQGNDEQKIAFRDVTANAYYYAELAVAVDLGIVTGKEGDAFGPNTNLTRQEMMVLAARAMKAAGKPIEDGGSLNAFSDAASVDADAKDSVASLVQAGVVNGKNGKIAPDDKLTRAEAAVILYRIWNL